MSKRFGRNQRRRAREEIAKLVDENSLLHVETAFQEKSLKDAAERVHHVERQLEMVREYLGPNHPAFPASRCDLGFKPQPEDPLSLYNRRGQLESATVMRFGTPQRREEERAVHYVLYAGQERVAYAISDHALRSCPRDVLAWSMTNELVRLLLDAMRKEPRG